MFDKFLLTEENYERLISVLKSKKKIILQGAPGVGKTFVAKRLHERTGKETQSTFTGRRPSRLQIVQRALKMITLVVIVDHHTVVL